MGNINFIRQDYAGAQRAFAEVIKKYPKSQRAPDAMLKLAQSFMSLGQKPEGCTTLALVKSRYPNAGANPCWARQASAKRPAANKSSLAEGIERAFGDAMARLAAPAKAWAVAVSGGGDSVALMHLALDYARQQGHPLPHVLTVDHGLRPSSARDAKAVAAWAKRLGLAATVLAWRGNKPKTNVEAAAREARYRLMGAFLVKHDIATLLVGHNQDDQAETFLLRLARGSGLDGLAGMQPMMALAGRGFPGLRWRGHCWAGRDPLRAYLEAKGQAWLD